MASLDRLLARMRNNPKGDWRIEQFKAIADRYGIAHRQPGTTHVTFPPPRQADGACAATDQAGVRAKVFCDAGGAGG
jgi:hypothetical protein